MRSGGRKSFMMWLGFVISAVAVYFAFRNEDFGRIMVAMKQANWLILVASMPIMLLSVVLRAWRWKYFIKNDVSTVRAKYNAVTIGFFVTNILPLRLGEFARVLVFAKDAKRSRVEILATIAVERFFDILAILILFVMVIPHIPFDAIRAGGADTDVVYFRYSPHVLMVGSLGIVACGLVGFLMVCHYGRRVWHWLVDKRDIRHPFLLRVVGSLFDGLEALWHSRKVIPALVLSVVLWFSVAFNFWITLLAFPSGATTLGSIIGIGGSVFLDTVLCFAVALPSAPGFIGVWQLAIKIAFIPYPVADSAAVSAFGILVFIIQYLQTIAMGLECLKSEGMSLADVKNVRADEPGANGEEK